MTAPRPLPDADQPWNHPHWSDANGPDLGAWVAVICATVVAGAAAVSIFTHHLHRRFA